MHNRRLRHSLGTTIVICIFDFSLCVYILAILFYMHTVLYKYVCMHFKSLMVLRVEVGALLKTPALDGISAVSSSHRVSRCQQCRWRTYPPFQFHTANNALLAMCYASTALAVTNETQSLFTVRPIWCVRPQPSWLSPHPRNKKSRGQGKLGFSVSLFNMYNRDFSLDQYHILHGWL